ncbi:MAG TPA: MFS transporter [Methylomirabilota bacterium]|nr:MFS transporter [Methylomirabilota bacterium]
MPIARRTVLCLGLSQLTCWGISYYLIGGFGDLIIADLGWSRSVVHGGFSAALVVMGLVSPLAGRCIDRYGGRPVMVVGSLVSAVGCAGLGMAHSLMAYYAAWLCLGLAMRLTLYDAAFAALARIGGVQAQRPIAQITLLGGLASTVFWPVGHLLADAVGWRGALFAYAGFALLTIPLHLAIPAVGGERALAPRTERPALAASPRKRAVAAGLYALIATLANFLNSGMSAHMIAILSGLGLAASAAVGIASLRGIGQSLARLGEVLFGGRLHPLTLNLGATLLLPPSFAAGLLSGAFATAAIAFAFLYGAGNGILTITRGTMPLVLFDPRSYGSLVGRLLVPSFLCSAAAPLLYALVIERFGNAAALDLSLAAAGVTFAAALALYLGFGRRGTSTAAETSAGP